ncbi:MAG: glycosyltransferase family 2 protein [Desulfobacterales bacterium]
MTIVRTAADPAPVAAVVLNHNGRELLLGCLRSLTVTAYQPLGVVVVDNASSDGSVEAVQYLFPYVHIVRNHDNAGVAGGRNTGLRWIDTHLPVEYILFLDNDTRVEPDTVGKLVEAAGRHPLIGMVAPKAFRKKGDDELLSAGGMYFNPYTGTLRDVAYGERDVGQYDQARDIQACPGFAFLARPAVFREIGGFDENFNPYGWEDVDLSLRAGKAGFRIVYAPGAVVYHAGGRAGRGIVSLYERHKARNLLYFVRRHATHGQWLCFLSVLPFRVLLRITKEILTGNGSAVRAWLAALRKDG